MSEQKKRNSLREHLYIIIFEADTPAGKAFDIALLVLIVISVLAVMLETVAGINQKFADVLITLEWVTTAVFTIEYLLRIYAAPNRKEYIFSFYGLIDLLTIVPSYFALVFTGAHYLLTIRSLRLLRVFRILKLGHFLRESQALKDALRASLTKIIVFIGAVLILVTILGALMYMIEGNGGGGFTSIPTSIYWAIVTLTTVGYGDIAPVTNLGQFISVLVMLLGYGIIAVPTGIVSAEMANSKNKEREAESKVITSQQDLVKMVVASCRHCQAGNHKPEALYCYHCGEAL